MGIVNKRNAVLGWIMLKLGRAQKKKARSAVPGPRTGGVAAGALAAIGGALFFWRKRRGTVSH
jgi:hypothetical protein